MHSFLTVILYILFLEIYGYNSKPCILPSDVNGHITSDGKAILYEGGNITVNCDFTNTSCIANDTLWYHNWEVLQNEGSNTFSIVTNKTHTILSLHNLTYRDNEDYFCTCRDDFIICTSRLEIGRSPAKPENVTVISNHFQNLQITWRVKSSIIPTKYFLYYKNSNQKPSTCDIKNINCPNETDDLCYSCLIDGSSFLYLNIYQFWIKASNQLQVINNLFEALIQPEQYVKLNPPTALNVTTINSGTILASWNLIFDYTGSPVNISLLYFDVSCELIDGKECDMCQHKGINTTATNITFNNLIPYRNYMLKVRAKLNYTTSYYSDFAFLNFITMEDVPQDAPVIVPGMFTITSNSNNETSRNVSIYWKEIDRLLYGSPNVWYLVQGETFNKSDAVSKTQNISMANIVITNDAYNITIKACNHHGEALNFSTIFIPAKDNIMNNLELDFFIHLKKPDPDCLNFTWFPLKTDSNITIYWCEDKKDSINCLQTLNWARMPKGSSSWGGLPLNLDKEYDIATSVESLVSSSGMSWWADCKALDTDELIELNLDFRSTSDTITLQWSTSCKHKSLIKDHYLSYCPSDYCKDPILIKNIPKTNSSLKLENLKSSTKYNITFYSNLLLEAKEKSKYYPISTKESNNSTIIFIVGGIVLAIIVLIILIGKLTGFTSVKQFKECRKVPEINLPEGILEKNFILETKLHNNYVINVCGLTTSGNDSKDINNISNYINVSSIAGSVIHERYKAESDDKQGNKQSYQSIPDIAMKNNFFIQSYITTNNNSFPILRNFDSLSSKYGSLPTVYSYVKKETNSTSSNKLYPGNFLNTYFEGFKGLNRPPICKSNSFPDLGIFYGISNENQSFAPLKSIQNLPSTQYSQIASFPVCEVKDIPNNQNHLEKQHLTASTNKSKSHITETEAVPLWELNKPIDPYMQIGGYKASDSNELEYLHSNQSIQNGYLQPMSFMSLEISQISPYSKCIIQEFDDNINESSIGGRPSETPLNQEDKTINLNGYLQPMSCMSLEISQISPCSKSIIQGSDDNESSIGGSFSGTPVNHQDTTVNEDDNLQSMNKMSLDVSQVSPYSICAMQESVHNINESSVGNVQPESNISLEVSEISPYSKCIIIELNDNESVRGGNSSPTNKYTEA